MSTHLHSTDVRNNCPFAADPLSRGSSDPRAVTCPACLRAIRAFDRATDETLKDAPAVRREVATP